MANEPRVRVFMAASLDGFIAGPGGDLGWLERDHAAPGDLRPDAEAVSFETFLRGVGALLMGRATYDVLTRMIAEGRAPWVYGETPVLVASHRAIDVSHGHVRRVEGSIDAMLDEARRVAGDKDVYVDGGDLVRQAIEAGRVDEMTLTLVPVLLAQGIRLFDGLHASSTWQFASRSTLGNGLVQITLRRRS